MDFDVRALELVARDQGVELDDVIETVENALTEAYRKGGGTDPRAQAHLNAADGKITVQSGDGEDITPPGFGSRGAAAARQAIVAWVRDLDRIRKVGQWAHREGAAVRATIRGLGRNGEQRLSVEGVEAVLPAGEAVPGENLRSGQSIDVLLLAANVTDRGTVKLTVSRRQPALISAVLRAEAPAVRSGAVEIISVAREPGVRCKVAFRGSRSDLLGPSGRHMRALAAAVSPEAIDLVEHDSDPAEFARRALTPAASIAAEVVPGERTAIVTVARDQVRAAVGRDNVNLRLANKLTGLKIQVVEAS